MGLLGPQREQKTPAYGGQPAFARAGWRGRTLFATTVRVRLQELQSQEYSSRDLSLLGRNSITNNLPSRNLWNCAEHPGFAHFCSMLCSIFPRPLRIEGSAKACQWYLGQFGGRSVAQIESTYGPERA